MTELKQPRRSACLSGIDDTSLSSLMHSRYSGKDEVIPEEKITFVNGEPVNTACQSTSNREDHDEVADYIGNMKSEGSTQLQRIDHLRRDGHAHQFRQRVGLHAFHDARAIQINGFCAHAQLLRDFAGGVTLHQR